MQDQPISKEPNLDELLQQYSLLQHLYGLNPALSLGGLLTASLAQLQSSVTDILAGRKSEVSLIMNEVSKTPVISSLASKPHALNSGFSRKTQRANLQTLEVQLSKLSSPLEKVEDRSVSGSARSLTPRTRRRSIFETNKQHNKQSSNVTEKYQVRMQQPSPPPRKQLAQQSSLESFISALSDLTDHSGLPESQNQSSHNSGVVCSLLPLICREQQKVSTESSSVKSHRRMKNYRPLNIN